MIKIPKPPRAPKPPRNSAGLPDDDTLLEALKAAREVDVNDLARKFGLKGDDRRALRQRLKALTEAGKLDKLGRKTFGSHGVLPDTGAGTVISQDVDGELWVKWGKDDRDTAPLARLAPLKKSAQALPPGLGDRVYVRFEKTADEWIAHLIKVLDQGAPKVIGVVRKTKRAKGQPEIRLESVNRKSKENYVLTGADLDKLKDGDVVMARPQGA